MKSALALLISVTFSWSTYAAKPIDIQAMTVARAADASAAVLPIMVWYSVSNAEQGGGAFDSYVAGTGFLVDDQGDFITAAHVLDISAVVARPGVSNAYLTANIRQKSGDGSGMRFTVMETDKDHDLALCHIAGFKVYKPEESPTAKSARQIQQSGAPNNRDMTHPFASLGVSKDTPLVGRFVIVSGFPLGSWTPTIQLGLISAVQEIYPPGIATVAKDSHQLLQISVSANHGNSGGPVIDLSSGDVVGVILQVVPAPVQLQGRQIYDPGNFAMSGIMLAAPATWVNTLLERHQVKSMSLHVGKQVIF